MNSHSALTALLCHEANIELQKRGFPEELFITIKKNE